MSRTNAFRLGLSPPLEEGELPGGQVTLQGPRGSIEVRKNVVIEIRHLRISKAEALAQGLASGSNVSAQIEGPRATIFRNVKVRVVESPKLDFEASIELDRDEANAAWVNPGDTATILLD